MGPGKGPVVLMVLWGMIQVSFGYVESLAANLDVPMGKNNKFVPMVAFLCNKPTMHTTGTGWVADSNTDCIHKPEKILKYCRELYPNLTITNIVEEDEVTITNWPSKKGRLHSHTVQPYRCVVGPFESDALLVPQHCEFFHEHNNCSTYQYWAGVAKQKCDQKGMHIDDFAMLLDCEIDRFAGVEYVCCPKKEKPIDKPRTLKPVKQETKILKIEEEDAYTAYLKGDEHFLRKFHNEHAKFLAAMKAMNKHHHDRITKMMKDWQEAREHVNKLKKTDPAAADKMRKDILQRFQKLYHGTQQADSAEKRQLVALHLQHRQAELNTRKRRELEAYMMELEKSPVVPKRVLKHLKHYIRIEEKDRLHSLNHFTHVKKQDPEEAKRIQPVVEEHMKVIDERIAQAVDMLHHFPDVEKDITADLDKFRRQYSGLAESALSVVMRPISLPAHKPAKNNEVWSSKEQIDDESDDGDPVAHGQLHVVEDDHVADKVKVHSETSNFVAHAVDNSASFHQASGKSMSSPVAASSTGSIFGIAIGSVAVFVIIIVAIIMIRRRPSHRHPVTHGFVEVDPAASPEERHVANMQMNGYENPTYKYFELNTNNASK